MRRESRKARAARLSIESQEGARLLGLALDEARARDPGRGPGGASRVACLRHGGTLYWAGLPRPPDDRLASRIASPITELIHGVWATEPELARRILRGRIFASHAPSQVDQAMVRVAARKLSAPVEPSSGGVDGGALELRRVGARDFAAADEGLQTLQKTGLPQRLERSDLQKVSETVLALAFSRAQTEGPRWSRDRPIAALLIAPDGRILDRAWNRSGHDATLHAELQLVRRWAARSEQDEIPEGSLVATSLKPCRMCAALLAAAGAGTGRLQVIYSEDDPGPNARDTVLDGLPWQRLVPART